MIGERDIGHGVVIAPLEDRTGIYWRHPGCRAWGHLRFQPDPRSTGHVLLAGSIDDLDALTIGGSLLCPKVGCGCHGHITNGKWVPS